MPPLERLRLKSDLSGECWTVKNTTGSYGKIKYRGTYVSAHVLSYRETYGELPPGKPFVCHRCNNPPCWRPEHLYAGTAKENTQDIFAAGNGWSGNSHWSKRTPQRIRRGANVYTAKLTEADIPIIRSRLADGDSVSSIARDYGVSRCPIKNIKYARGWTHVP